MYNYIQIDIPTLKETSIRAQSVTISQSRYAHDVMTLKLLNWKVKYDNLTTGTPLKVTLTNQGAKQEFVGYIHHIKPNVSPTKNHVELEVIGASFPMKQQGQKVWSNTTADRVVRELAKKHRFAFDITPHPRVFAHITQGGMSDWELCAKLAKQCGYTFRVEGTTVYFEPITKQFTDKREASKVYSMGSMATPALTNMYSFKPLLGDSVHLDGETFGAVAVHGSDPIIKKEHSYSNQKAQPATKSKQPTQLFDRHETRTVAPSMAAAKFEQDAAKERSRFAYRAVAEVHGDPDLKLDMPIYLDNVGKDYEGYWVVLSVEHHIENHKYVTTVELGTDSLGQSSVWVDGKNTNMPKTGVRVLKQGKANPGVKQSTYLLGVGASSKAASKNHFGATKNVPIQKTSSGKVAPMTAWASTTTDISLVQLKQPPVRLAVKQRLEKKNG